MPVPIACPKCGADHLHAAVYLDAESGDRFEIIGDADADGKVLAHENPQGRLTRPEEALLSCCACDWTTDVFLTWSDS